MALIHKSFINYPLRTIFRPFRTLIPERFFFAINGTVKIKLSEKKKLLLNGNPTSNLVRVLFWKGIEGFEYDAYKVFSQLSKKSKVFLDIGANIGYYSIVAKIFNPKIEVIGFEPLPAAYKFFKKNTILNNVEDIKIEKIALSNKKGTFKFYSYNNTRFKNIPDQLVGDGSLNPNVNKSKTISETEVNTETLDQYVNQNFPSNKKIDLIKIDTEATEHLVLEGATNVLSNHRPIIMCEIINGQIEKEVQKILKNHNYNFYKVTKKGLSKLENLSSENKDDYFMIPAEKSDLIKDFIQ